MGHGAVVAQDIPNVLTGVRFFVAQQWFVVTGVSSGL